MDSSSSKGQEVKASKKGLNWPAIIIIIIIVLILGYLFWAKPLLESFKSNPIVQSAMRLQPAIDAMEEMTQAQIEQQAAHYTAAFLGTDPFGLEDRFVVIEGNVSKEESMAVERNIAKNIFSDANYKAFVLDDSVVLIDITGTAPTVSDGTRIKGFGKVIGVRISDIWDLPIIGEDLEKEFGNVEGMGEVVVFHLSKGIKVVEPITEPEEEAAPAEETPAEEAPAEEAPAEEAPAEEAPAEEAPAEEAPAEEPPAEELPGG